MKLTCIILFTLGFFWAYVCLGFTAAPIVFAFENWSDVPIFHILGFLILILLIWFNTILGYWVWINWLQKFKKNKFYKFSNETFWKTSLVNHLSWLLLLPLMFGSLGITEEINYNPIKTWLTGVRFWPHLIWPLLLSFISVIFIIVSKKENQTTSV